MGRRSSPEPVALLTPEERYRELKRDDFDVEASPVSAEPPRDINVDHEYSIASTVKFTWLGTYFFFSLILTLYNKLVLGTVGR